MLAELSLAGRPARLMHVDRLTPQNATPRTASPRPRQASGSGHPPPWFMPCVSGQPCPSAARAMVAARTGTNAVQWIQQSRGRWRW